VGALPNQGVGVSRLEALIEEELERVKAEGVTERELQKVKNQRRARTIMSRQTVSSKASALHRYRYEGDLSKINTELDEYMAIEAEDLLRVARKYLVPENRTVVIARPPQPTT